MPNRRTLKLSANRLILPRTLKLKLISYIYTKHKQL